MSDTMRPKRRKVRAVMYRDISRRDDKRVRKSKREMAEEMAYAKAHLDRWNRKPGNYR